MKKVLSFKLNEVNIEDQVQGHRNGPASSELNI